MTTITIGAKQIDTKIRAIAKHTATMREAVQEIIPALTWHALQNSGDVSRFDMLADALVGADAGID